LPECGEEGREAMRPEFNLPHGPIRPGGALLRATTTFWLTEGRSVRYAKNWEITAFFRNVTTVSTPSGLLGDAGGSWAGSYERRHDRFAAESRTMPVALFGRTAGTTPEFPV